jgi:hypothetical protein
MNWFIFVGLFLVAWFWQNVTHGFSHLFAGWLWEGRKPLKLIPWPHKYKGKFYFSRYEGDVALKNGSPTHRHSAPIHGAIIQVAITMGVFVGGVLEGIAGIYYLVPFIIAPVVDASVWMRGYLRNKPGTDGARWRQQVYLDAVGEMMDRRNRE